MQIRTISWISSNRYLIGVLKYKKKKEKKSLNLNFRNLKKRGQEAGYVEATFVTQVQEKAIERVPRLFYEEKANFRSSLEKKISEIRKEFLLPLFQVSIRLQSCHNWYHWYDFT